MKRVLSSLLLAAAVLPAATTLQFEIIDGRGKETSAITIEAGASDQDGWRSVKIGKAKGDPVLLWPFDGLAKRPDGPEPIPAIVIQRGEEKALGNKRIVAAIGARVVLGVATLEEISSQTAFSPKSLEQAFEGLVTSTDPFEKGVGLLYAGKSADAAESLGLALRQRQRQLTRVPSEIYPVAMLDGMALFKSNKFDDSSVAFMTALKQRPSDEAARKFRADALAKAGKPEAAER